jgi:tetraacyldisaccharide 4'-kinase
MIASCCAGVAVVAGSDRYRAGRVAIERFHPDLVILDDGFQHVRLHRDLNILLVDGADPFGNGRLFPAGILREPLGQLGRADAVLVTRAAAAADLADLKERISRITRAAIFTSNIVPRDLVNLETGAAFPLEGLRGAAVIAAAGIGRPDSLQALLTGLGAEVRYLKSFPDHHRYRTSDLEELRRLAADRGADMIVTTEKDAVKLAGMAGDDLWMLRIRLAVVETERWERVLWGS